MADVRRPTTEQLHEASRAMVAATGKWPFSAGLAAGIDPAGGHEVQMVEVGAGFVRHVAPKRWPWSRQPVTVEYQHRVALRLRMLGRDEPQLLLADVLATHWDRWPR